MSLRLRALVQALLLTQHVSEVVALAELPVPGASESAVHETRSFNADERSVMDSLTPAMDGMTREIFIIQLKDMYDAMREENKPGWQAVDFSSLNFTVRDITEWRQRKNFVTVNGAPGMHARLRAADGGWTPVQRERVFAAAKAIGLRCADTANWEVTRAGLRPRAPQQSRVVNFGAAAGGTSAAGGTAPAPSAAAGEPVRGLGAVRRERDQSPPRSPRELPSPVNAQRAWSSLPPSSMARGLDRKEATRCQLFTHGKCTSLCRDACENSACGPGHCKMLQAQYYCMTCSIHPSATPKIVPPPPPAPMDVDAAQGGA